MVKRTTYANVDRSFPAWRRFSTKTQAIIKIAKFHDNLRHLDGGAHNFMEFIFFLRGNVLFVSHTTICGELLARRCRQAHNFKDFMSLRNTRSDVYFYITNGPFLSICTPSPFLVIHGVIHGHLDGEAHNLCKCRPVLPCVEAFLYKNQSANHNC